MTAYFQLFGVLIGSSAAPWHADSNYVYGSKLQDGKKVLEMSQLHPHSNSRHFQTSRPTDLGLLPSWKSIVGPPTQEFSPSWGARKRVQEIVEIS